MTENVGHDAESSQEDPRQFSWKPLTVNGGILLLVAIGAFLVARGSKSDGYEALEYMIVMMYGVGAQSGVNGLVALILGLRRRKELALTYLLSAIAVGIVGAGLCFGGAEIY